jgi:6-pyruvoyltetrahydropterin/6-carboxytetrahydropterin synthase
VTRPDTVRITRTVSFSAAHRYENRELTEQENRAVFGACYRPHGHGHNYRVDVTVEGPVDPITGMVMNLADLDDLLDQEVVQKLDHTFLNYDVPHFAEVIPTCENLALYLWNVLNDSEHRLGTGRLAAVRVWESDDLFAEVEASPLSPEPPSVESGSRS